MAALLSSSDLNRAKPLSAAAGGAASNQFNSIQSVALDLDGNPIDWETYIEWCRNLGAHVSASLEVRSLPGDERGVFATKDIAADDALVAVPFESLLTVVAPLSCTPALQGKAQLLCAALAKVSLEDDALALRLLFERFQAQETSRWSGHIAVLPASYPHTLIEWPTEELAELKGSSVKVLAERWQEQVATDYVSLAALQVAKGKTLGEAFEWFRPETYRWALATIWTRCVSVHVHTRSGGGAGELTKATYKAFSPFFDLFNHSPAARMEHGLRTVEEVGGAALTVVARQTYKAGEEVFINYGPESNSRLCLIYGFVVEAAGPGGGGGDADGAAAGTVGGTVAGLAAGAGVNPFDEVPLYAALTERAPNYALKQQVLRRRLQSSSGGGGGSGGSGGGGDKSPFD